MQVQKIRNGYKIVKLLFGKYEEIPEEWESSKLGNHCTMYVPMRDKPKKFDGEIPWLRIEDLDGKFVSDTKSNQYVSHEIVKKMNLKIYPIGTVLCSCSATIGVCAITKKELITNQTFIGIFPNSEINNEFLYYFLQTQKNNLVKLGSGSTILYISRKKFEEFPIVLPEIQEQQKIASILSNVDSLISQTQKEIEATQRLKKGLMQKLLTRGIGHTKFKKITLFPRYDDEIIPESWNVERLEKLIKIIDYRGRTPPFSENGIIHLRSNNIRYGKINFDDITYVTEETYNKYMTRGIPQENDILFTTEGPLGEVALVPKNFKFSLAQRIIVLRPKTKDLSPLFLKFLLQNKLIKHRYEGLSTGTTLGGIASKWFTKLLLMFPTDIEEQDKIAKTLISIENKIDSNKLVKEKLESLKKGLMQKLLTGQIRVKT